MNSRAFDYTNIDIPRAMQVIEIDRCLSSLSDKEIKYLLRQEIIQALNNYLSFDAIRVTYGFKSIAAVENYLDDPYVTDMLLDSPIFLRDPLPEGLAKRARMAYDEASYNRNQHEVSREIEELSTLTSIFQFIKTLSDKEIELIDSLLPASSKEYYKDNLLSFRDDLNAMDLASFETKYAGCYAGMLDNFLFPLILIDDLHKKYVLSYQSSSAEQKNDAISSISRKRI